MEEGQPKNYAQQLREEMERRRVCNDEALVRKIRNMARDQATLGNDKLLINQNNPSEFVLKSLENDGFAVIIEKVMDFDTPDRIILKW